jgi:integrase
MASVHKIPSKPNWICFFTDREGKRRCKSTRTNIKREAVRVCGKIQELEDKARSGRLTPERARRVIETTVADILESLGSPLEQKTVKAHFESWQKVFAAEVAPGTFERYQGVVTQFLAFLGGQVNRDLSTLTTADIERYRDKLISRVAPRTVNLHLKVLRIALERAVKQHVFDKNPARLIDNVNTDDHHERRAFSLDELRKILTVAGEEWRTVILTAVYTGLRLSDIVNLTWLNVNLQTGEITLAEQKTGKIRTLPIAKPLVRHLEGIPAGDNPKAPLCPGLCGKAPSWLSNQFGELLATAGLATSRIDHRKKKSGRGARRHLSELSFHSLRHTSTSLLKNAGVSDVVARDLIGHESASVSRIYTHIEESVKRAALDKLPDLVKD